MTSYSFRIAVEEDLPHMAVLSGEAGGKIRPGGGDFVLMAWPKWWKQHPKLHFNQWCFDGESPAGFVRIECYGPPDAPESGWLEGLRISPSHQGRGVMSKVVSKCCDQVPADMPIFLAVGSTNVQMVPIADRKYDFLGAMIMHVFRPPSGAAKPDAAAIACM